MKRLRASKHKSSKARRSEVGKVARPLPILRQVFLAGPKCGLEFCALMR